MLKEARNQLIADIKAELEIELVDKYRGEFEEGSDWNPRPRNCFIQALGNKPNIRWADGIPGHYRGSFRIYGGANSKNNIDGLEVIELIAGLLNNKYLNFTVDGNPKTLLMKMTDEGWNLIYSEKGFEGYSFDLDVFYTETITVVAPPSQVELVSPANDASDVETGNADLEWLAPSGAADYEILISSANDFSNTVFRQPGYKYLKLTVPEGTLEIDTEYWWKVRAKNSGGNGEWSIARNFTTGTPDAVQPLNPSEISNNVLWLRSDTGVTAVAGNKVSQWNDQSGQNNHFVQATDANRPVLTVNAFGTHSGLYHDPTGNVRKTLGYNDTTKKFEILAGSARSILITFIADDAHAQGNNGQGLISRSNSNAGTNYILGKYNDNLFNVRGVLQFPYIVNNNVAALPLAGGKLTQGILVYDGNNISVYIDGNLVSYYTRAIATPIVSETATWFLIGAEYHTANNGINFKGYTFEMAFWNKALSASEVESLYEYHKQHYLS